MTEVARTETRGKRKVRKGIVVSRSGDKTVVVQVERKYRHPLYGKEVRSFRKFHAHDENNEVSVGDRVTIIECRPISRMKCWRCVVDSGKPASAVE